MQQLAQFQRSFYMVVNNLCKRAASFLSQKSARDSLLQVTTMNIKPLAFLISTAVQNYSILFT